MENLHVILIGAPEDADLAEKILRPLANRRSVWSLIGHVKLADLPALLTRCTLFIGNNSGPQHIAAGLGVSTVGIHSGVVDAREWGPKGTRAVALQRAMTCAPCYHTKPAECPRALACLRELSPRDVLQVCQQLLATTLTGGKQVAAPSSRQALRVRSERQRGQLFEPLTKLC